VWATLALIRAVGTYPVKKKPGKREVVELGSEGCLIMCMLKAVPIPI
jgi:hypothetical protein